MTSTEGIGGRFIVDPKTGKRRPATKQESMPPRGTVLPLEPAEGGKAVKPAKEN